MRRISIESVEGLSTALSDTVSATTPNIAGGAIDTTTIVIKQSASPTPTVEGDMQWDTNDDRLVIGTGGGQAVFMQVTPWVVYTPTILGFGTPTGVNFRSRRVGGSLEVQGIFVCGNTTAVPASITLGYNGTNGGIIVSTVSGTARMLVGASSISSASTAFFTILAANGDGFVNFGVQSGAFGGMNVRNGNDLSITGVTYGVNFTVPINGW